MKQFLLTALAALFFLQACTDGTETKARDAYLYAYPLVTMNETRKATAMPANTLDHRRSFPDHNFRRVVRPNVDTLYSTIWFDLKQEPVVLSIPANDDIYYLMPILDAWTNVLASPGTRTIGDDGGVFLIAGPDWKGATPDSMTLYHSPSNIVWMIGRLYAENPDDLSAVHEFQDGMRAMPLSQWQSDTNASTSPSGLTAQNVVNVNSVVTAMSAPDFFESFQALLQDNPPLPADGEFVTATLEPLGLGESNKSKPSDKTLEAAKEKALKRLALIDKMRKPGPTGWIGVTSGVPLGQYGTKYQLRAYVAHVGLGANEPVDAIYPYAVKDAEGRALNGQHAYKLHFPADQLPPVNAFWSLTTYDAEFYLVENPINRYALGSRDALQYNEDGSLDLYIQATAPEGQEANWLPTPQDADFSVMLRLYWPEEAALDGSWQPPSLERL
jgi:hypothetical protein